MDGSARLRFRRYASGVIAGLGATLTLTALDALRLTVGAGPDFDMLGLVRDAFALDIAGAWAVNLGLGSLIYGPVFAALEPGLPGQWLAARGMVLGVVAWLAVSLIFMPLAGAAPFGIAAGLDGFCWGLGFHMAFGAALGIAYSATFTSRPRPGFDGAYRFSKPALLRRS
jgi:hypothetical protein